MLKSNVMASIGFDANYAANVVFVSLFTTLHNDEMLLVSAFFYPLQSLFRVLAQR